MISKKVAKNKLKRKKLTKRSVVKKTKRNPERYPSSMGTMASPSWHANEPIDKLWALLDKRSAKAASSMSKTSHHYDGISDNIEKDIEYNDLKENPSKSELLNYLRTKKEILESIITDFIRFE